jgi:hypothetical protein
MRAEVLAPGGQKHPHLEPRHHLGSKEAGRERTVPSSCSYRRTRTAASRDVGRLVLGPGHIWPCQRRAAHRSLVSAWWSIRFRSTWRVDSRRVLSKVGGMDVDVMVEVKAAGAQLPPKRFFISPLSVCAPRSTSDWSLSLQLLCLGYKRQFDNEMKRKHPDPRPPPASPPRPRSACPPRRSHSTRHGP